MILLRHVIQQHHISILKRQPFNDWCFITSSASALGSIFTPPQIKELPRHHDECMMGFAKRI
jgi:hypothetical protein